MRPSIVPVISLMRTYHWVFKPGKAMVSSFSGPVRIMWSGQRSPDWITERSRGATPCSRNDIASGRLFLIINRGAMVITFVNLYLPRPSLHDKPAWTSSDLCFREVTTKAISTAWASTLIICKHMSGAVGSNQSPPTLDHEDSPI